MVIIFLGGVVMMVVAAGAAAARTATVHRREWAEIGAAFAEARGEPADGAAAWTAADLAAFGEGLRVVDRHDPFAGLVPRITWRAPAEPAPIEWHAPAGAGAAGA